MTANQERALEQTAEPATVLEIPMEPEHPEIGVLAFVPDRWGRGFWMPRQHCLTRLARHYRVVWVNPAQEWRHARSSNRAHRVFSRPLANRPGFTVYDPPSWLPQFYRPGALAKLAFDLRARQACRELWRQGCRRLVVYLWRPEFARALDVLDADLTCYHIDDEYSFSSEDLPNSPEECALIERVDQVIVHSAGLMEKKGFLNPRNALLPLGVDYREFSAEWPEPEDLRAIPHPRIGYMGILKKQLDWPVLQFLAAGHPEWSFVLIGSVSRHPEAVHAVEEIGRLPNVHLLGAKPPTEVARYTRHLDVCLMPYLTDGYTRYIYPLKLHEYLAAGRPAVGARIRTLEDFAGIVELPVTHEEWAAAVTRSLSAAENSASRVRARQNVARQHDWDLLVDRLAALFGERLREARQRRSLTQPFLRRA